MKILQIIETLDIGGAENFTAQLCNQLSEVNEITLIVTGSSHPNHNYKQNLKSNIKLHELNWGKKYSIIQFFKLLTHIIKIKPEIIHVHLHNSFYYLFAISFFYRKPVYIHTIHSSVKVWASVLTFINKFRFLNNKIHHVCISKSIFYDMMRKFPKLKSFHINNGIEDFKITRNQNDISEQWQTWAYQSNYKFKLLSIGNISKYKNYTLLAESLKNSSVYPEIIAVIIGRTNLKEELSKIQMYQTPNLVIAGPYKNAADFLSQADALLISSLEEGMPLVALEALSLGVSIITTPAGGMKDIIKNNYNGFISDDFTWQSLQKCIDQFINLSALQRNEMGKNAKLSFEENYNIKMVADSYLNFYKNALENQV